MPLEITNPADNGDPFPATITGTYDTGGGGGGGGLPGPCTIPVGLVITVTVTKAGGGYSNAQVAEMACVTNSTGTWSCPKPGDLQPNQTDYIITATSTAGSDSKSNITT